MAYSDDDDDIDSSDLNDRRWTGDYTPSDGDADSDSDNTDTADVTDRQDWSRSSLSVYPFTVQRPGIQFGGPIYILDLILYMHMYHI